MEMSKAKTIMMTVALIALMTGCFYLIAHMTNDDLITEAEWKSEISHAKTVTAEPLDDHEPKEAEPKDYIEETAEMYGLDPGIVKAIIKVESGGDPNAVGDGGEAIGLMQIQPRWHKERMERLGVTDLTDPESNVRVGCDYLAELLNKYDWDYIAALTAYNAGTATAKTDYAEKILNERA